MILKIFDKTIQITCPVASFGRSSPGRQALSEQFEWFAGMTFFN
jgi:hypothetical protein